ncbi:SAM-dependent methyltransferase [Candidatus Uhrbacteria bacterium]|nr:SAM-dependent methyltransferase [Candidatus Uhrbacteria bacterium]
MVILFAYFVFLVILLAFAFAMLGTLFADAPFVPSNRRDLERIFSALKLTPGAKIYDLGSGDGRVARVAASYGLRAVGIEQSRVLTWWARFRAFLRRRSKYPVSFVHGNFWAVNLGDAAVIFCYLLPDAMIKLKDKFERELMPGTYVISRAFSIPGWKATEVLRFGKRKMPVYLYSFPLCL